MQYGVLLAVVMAVNVIYPHVVAEAAGLVALEDDRAAGNPLAQASHEPRGPGPEFDCARHTTYDPAQFDRVLENFDQTRTLRLDGRSWNNTLVRNCRIHDTRGDGIYVRNVRNLVVQNCVVWNVKRGIKVSSTGSTEDVTIDGNYIHDIDGIGISAGQRSRDDGDQKNLRILNNRIENTGLRHDNGHTHPIYVQSRDFLIEGNVISGSRDGNGISVRSSGIVRCNRVSGVSSAGKPAIRYYSDHHRGPSNTLLIEQNIVASDHIGIDLMPPTDRYDGRRGLNHVVENFVIRNNRIQAPVAIRVAKEYEADKFTVQVYDNVTGGKALGQ